MKRYVAVLGAVALTIGLVGSTAAHGNSHKETFKAHLDGYHEVPAISTTATGTLRLDLNSAGNTLAYTLTFSALQGGAASAAHIHFAQPSVNGGVLAFLCGGGGKPACPAAGGTVAGTITESDIQAIADQGIAAGDFAAALHAIRSHVTYVNVHSATFAAGEIRGQIK